MPSTHTSDSAAACGDFPPPHAREGHEVVRGRCHWGRRWHRAPLLVVGGNFSWRHRRLCRRGRWSRCPRGCLRIVGRQRHLVVGGRASGPALAVVLRQIVGLPHLCTIPIVEKEIVLSNHQPCGTILSLFQAGEQRDGNAASPPLIFGDSRFFHHRAEGEAAAKGLVT